MPVVVENAETLDENEYLFPQKSKEERVVNVLKSINVTGRGCCSRMPIRDNVPSTP